MKRNHILSVIGDLEFGGGENRLLAFAKYVDCARFEHTVVTINEQQPDDPNTMYREYLDAGIAVGDLGESHSVVNKHAWRKGMGFGRKVHKLCRVIEELQVDLIDAHLESASLIAAAAGFITRKPRVMTLYHPHPLVRPPFWSAAQQFILANASRVITDSAVRGREIQDVARIRRPELVVIPNGVIPPKPTRPREEMRTRFGIPTDPNIRVIGQLSSLVEFKGHMALLSAARRILAINPDVFFLIVGFIRHESDYKARLERRIAELGIGDRVRIVSYPGYVGDVWSAIDIHVHASSFDSLPNAIIEGMSLGKPAVVTAVGGIPDAVHHGVSGLVVPPGNAEALGDALLKILRDPILAQKLGTAARLRYRQTYRPEVIARRLESCFLEVIHGRCLTDKPYSLQGPVDSSARKS